MLRSSRVILEAMAKLTHVDAQVVQAIFSRSQMYGYAGAHDGPASSRMHSMSVAPTRLVRCRDQPLAAARPRDDSMTGFSVDLSRIGECPS
jgi:hypothetical protein